MSEASDEQLNPREQLNPEEVTEEHLHDVFTVPSELSPEVAEVLSDAGFELSQEPEPQPYPEPPNVYESASESTPESPSEPAPPESPSEPAPEPVSEPAPESEMG
jgi:hypothetical protein